MAQQQPPIKDPLGILGHTPESKSDPLGILSDTPQPPPPDPFASAPPAGSGQGQASTPFTGQAASLGGQPAPSAGGSRIPTQTEDPAAFAFNTAAMLGEEPPTQTPQQVALAVNAQRMARLTDPAKKAAPYVPVPQKEPEIPKAPEQQYTPEYIAQKKEAGRWTPEDQLRFSETQAMQVSLGLKQRQLDLARRVEQQGVITPQDEQEAAMIESDKLLAKSEYEDALKEYARSGSVVAKEKMRAQANENFRRAKQYAQKGDLLRPEVLEEYIMRPVANAVNEFGMNLLGGTARTLDVAGNIPAKLQGQEEYYSPFAQFADFVTEGLDYVAATEAEATKGAMFEEGGWAVNSDAILPNFLRMGVYMAGLVGSGGVGGRGAVGLTSYLTTEEDYYREAIDAGLSPQQAQEFSIPAAALTAGLEGINPQLYAQSTVKGQMVKRALKALKEGSSTKEALRDAAEFIGKEVGQENLQEFAQSAGDLTSKYMANMAVGDERFDVSMTPQEAVEIAIMTTALTGLVAGGARAMDRPLYRQSIEWAVQNPDQVREYVAQTVPREQQAKVLQELDRNIKAYNGLPETLQGEQKRTVAAAVVEKERIKEEQAASVVDDVVATITGNKFEERLKEQDEIIAQATGTTLADVLKKREALRLQEQYDKAKLKSEVTGKPMPDGMERPNGTPDTPAPTMEWEGEAVAPKAQTPKQDESQQPRNEKVPEVVEGPAGPQEQRDEASGRVDGGGQELLREVPSATVTSTPTPENVRTFVGTPTSMTPTQDGEAVLPADATDQQVASVVEEGDSVPVADTTPPAPKEAVAEEGVSEAAKKEVASIVRSAYGNVMNLAGPSNSGRRQRILELLTGTKPPKAKSGINAVEEALFEASKAQGLSAASKRDAMYEWLGLTQKEEDAKSTKVDVRSVDPQDGVSGVGKEAATKEGAEVDGSRVSDPEQLPNAEGRKADAVAEKPIDVVRRLRAIGLDNDQIQIHPDYVSSKKDEANKRARKAKLREEFLSSSSSVRQRGQWEKALSEELRFAEDNYSTPIGEKIEKLIDEGWSIVFDSSGNQKLSADNKTGYGTGKIGKIGMDYARFLYLGRDASPAPKAPEGEKKTTPKKPTAPKEPPPQEAKTPGWRREGAKPVTKPTNLSGEKDIRAYSIPGFEDIPIIVAKDKGGWRAAIAAGGLEMNLDTGHPTAGIAAMAAQEKLSRAGREKVEALVEKKIQEQQSLADRIERAADELEQKLKGMTGAFVIPPQALVGAMRAAAKVVRAGASVANAVKEAIAYLRRTDWYKKLSAPDKSKAEREVREYLRVALEPREPKSPSPKTVKKAAETGTVRNEAKTVEVDERMALRDQIKGKARAAREAKADVRSKQKEFAASMKETLKDLYGSLTPKQAHSLTNRALYTNPDNPKAVSRFADYVDRVIKNANFSEDVEQAQEQQKKAKRLLKQKGIPANHVEILSRIKDINPERLKDPAKFAALVKDYLSTFANPSSLAYQMASTPYMDEQLSAYEGQQERDFARMVEEEFDVDVDGVDAKELYEALMSDGYDELAKAMSEEKKQKLRERLIQQAIYSQMALEGLRQESYTPQEWRIIEAIKSVDPSRIAPKNLIALIRHADNIAVNNSFSGSKAISELASAIKAMDKYVKTHDLTRVRQAWRNLLGKTFQEEFTSVSGAFRFIKGMTAEASDLIYASGIHEINKAKAILDKDLREVGKSLDTKLKAIGKKNPEANSGRNRLFEGIAAYAIQRIPGMDMDQSFQAHKEMILQDIEKKSKLKDYQKEAVTAQEFYEEVLEGSNTIEDFVDKYKERYPEGWQVLTHLMDTNKLFEDEILDHKEQMWNQLSERNNPYYLTTSYRPISGKRIETEAEKYLTMVQKGALGRPKQAGKTKDRQKIVSLPEGKIIDYNIRGRSLAALKENLYDTRTSGLWERVAQFTQLPEAESVFGSIENKDYVVGVLNNLRKGQLRDPIIQGQLERIADQVASFGKKAAASLALGGVTQIPKQAADQLTNAIINVGDPKIIGRMMMETQKADDLLSIGAIGERGELVAGTSWDNDLEAKVSRIGEALKNENVARLRELYKDLNNFWLSPLRASDVFAARTAFLSFYTKHLEDRGESLKDWKEEASLVMNEDEMRNKAFAYAEMMTDLTQGSSDPTKLAAFSRRSDSGILNVLKAVVNPFSTFSVSIRERIVNDVADIRHYGKMPASDESSAQAYDKAVRSLAATMVSNAAFTAVKLYVAKSLVSAGASLLISAVAAMSDDDDEREEMMNEIAVIFEVLYTLRLMDTDAYRAAMEARRKQEKMTALGPEYDKERERLKEADRKWQMAYSAWTRDMVVGGLTTFAEDAFIDGMNRLYYEGALIMGLPSVMDSKGRPIKFDKWQREGDTPFYRFGQGRDDTSLGVFDVVLDRGREPYKAIKRATQGEQQKADEKTNRMLREFRDRNKERDEKRDEFIYRRMNTSDPNELKAIESEYRDWLKELRAQGESDGVLKGLIKAMQDAPQDAALEPWVRDLKNTPSTKARAVKLYQKLKSADPDKKIEMLRSVQVSRRGSPLIVTPDFVREFNLLKQKYGAP